MSGQLLLALCMGGVAILFTWMLISMLRNGSTSSWFNRDQTVLRADDAPMFWLWWSGWAVASGFWWFLGVRELLDWHATPDPAPAEWTSWLYAVLLFAMFGFILQGKVTTHRIWRHGNPLRATTRARLRREAALREMIRNLADDPYTGWDDMTLDELVDLGDFSYLDAVVAHLLAQPEPRRLALAIAELREEEFPMDPDDRAHLVELGIDPDAPLEDDDEEAKAPP